VAALATSEDMSIRDRSNSKDKISETEAAKDPFFKKVVDSLLQYAANVVQGRRAMFPSYEFAADYYWKKR
jgi:hypothetical protein